MPRTVHAASPALLLAALIAGRAGAADDPRENTWADFRGGGASVTDAADLPLTWSPEDGVAWTVELPGVGQSSPVVAGGRAYVTSVEGPNQETLLVSAVDPATGGLLWTERFDAARTSPNDFMHGRAAPTPVVDAGGVVAFFASGDLVALSPDGDERWRRNLWADYGPFENRHDLGTSPAQSDDAVFLQLDHGGPSRLLAVDKADGRTLWSTDRDPRMSFTSPVVATIGGVPQVVCSSDGSVDGYDAATGERLWTFGGLTGNTIPSPVVIDDRVYVGAKPGRRDPDLAATRDSNCCLRVVREAGEWSAEPAWRAGKTVSDYASPLVHRGRVYFLNNVGVLSCLDAATGDTLFRDRLGHDCWATPVGAGDRVYLFGREGECTVIAAADRLEVSARNRLWDAVGEGDGRTGPNDDGAAPGTPPAGEYDGPFVYGVAPVRGGFLVRTESRLYRVGAASGGR